MKKHKKRNVTGQGP